MATTFLFLNAWPSRNVANHMCSYFRTLIVCLMISNCGGLAEDYEDETQINCTLAILRIWSGELLLNLQPQFSPDVFHYGVIIDFDSGPLWPDAETVGDNGCEARRSDSGGDVPAGGHRDILVVVNSDEPKEYTVRVRRRRGDDVQLTSLGIDGASFSPDFSADRPEYVAKLAPLTAALPWRVVLSCVPVDEGQTVQLTSVEPASAMADRTVRALMDPPAPMVLDTGGARRGSRNITLGRLANSGTQLLDVDGNPRLLPLRVQVRVWPADRGSAAPGSYTIQLNAPLAPLTTTSIGSTTASTTSTTGSPATSASTSTAVTTSTVASQVGTAYDANREANTSDAGPATGSTTAVTLAPVSTSLAISGELAQASTDPVASNGLMRAGRRRSTLQQSFGGKALTMSVVVGIVFVALLSICRMHPPDDCVEPPVRALAGDSASATGAADEAEANVMLLRAAVLAST